MDMDNLPLLMEEYIKEDSLMDTLKEREQSDYQMVKLLTVFGEMDKYTRLKEVLTS